MRRSLQSNALLLAAYRSYEALEVARSGDDLQWDNLGKSISITKCRSWSNNHGLELEDVKYFPDDRNILKFLNVLL